jgi:hypothetical protein
MALYLLTYFFNDPGADFCPGYVAFGARWWRGLARSRPRAAGPALNAVCVAGYHAACAR